MFLNYKLLVEFTDYMIIFPIKWYNFLNRVINKSTVYVNVIIIPKNKLTKYKKTFNDIIDILNNNDIVTRQSENRDFVIIYFQNSKIIKIFDMWLNMITLRACIDLFKEVKCSQILNDDFFIIYDNIRIGVSNNTNNNINISLKAKNNINTIIYNYNYFTFMKEIEESYYLQKFAKNV